MKCILYKLFNLGSSSLARIAQCMLILSYYLILSISHRIQHYVQT